MGSDALNVALVRNNGLTLDPILAQELYSSETGGPDVTFLPGTWVTFAKKGTNPGTAQAKSEAETTVYSPTLRFKGKDGHIIGLNELDMEQAIGDPAARIIFKQSAAASGGPLDANYIRFEDNFGSLIGLANIYRRDGSDGRSGSNMDLAIWAHLALGGDFTVLNAGDTVNGETANMTGTIRFGLGNTARIYLAGPGDLRIEGNNAVRVKAPAVTVEGNLNVTGNSDFAGSVTMHNNLDMSNTDINNVRNLRAVTAILNNLTLNGATGSSSSPYNVWVANATNANYAANAGHAAVADSLAEGFDISPYLPTPTPDTGGGGPVIADDLTPGLWRRVEDLVGEGGEFDGKLTEDGWVKLPNGLIMQWGVTPGRSGAADAQVEYVRFPIPFPHTAFSGSATTEVVKESVDIDWWYQISSLTKDGMDVIRVTANRNHSDITKAHWIAVGY
jgi:hypothetical protein